MTFPISFAYKAFFGPREMLSINSDSSLFSISMHSFLTGGVDDDDVSYLFLQNISPALYTLTGHLPLVIKKV